MNAPGKNFLKVPGILMVIFSVLGIVLSLAGTACASCAAGAVGAVGIALRTLLAGILSAVLGGVVGLVTGIAGVKFCEDTSKAQTCFILAIIFLAVVLLGNIFGGFHFLDIADYALGILYLLGAIKNKQAA